MAEVSSAVDKLHRKVLALAQAGVLNGDRESAALVTLL